MAVVLNNNMKRDHFMVILLSSVLNLVASTYVYLQLCDKCTNTLTTVHTTEYWLFGQ